MAKKSFKKDGKGFQGLNFSNEVENDPKQEENQVSSSPTPEETSKEKIENKNTKSNPYRQSKKGFERYTFMINAEFVPQVKDLAQASGVKIKDVLNVAISEYLEKNWSKERQEKIKQLREELGLD